MGKGEIRALRVEHGILDVRGEADRVHDGVQDREGGFDLREGGVDLLVGGDVALDEPAFFALAQVGEQLFGVLAKAIALVAEDEGGAGVRQRFGDAVGNAALIGDTEDDGDLPLHINHVFRVLP